MRLMGTWLACTLRDVARAAGVSTATVSRVVHGKDRVRASTRQRVLEVVEALGFVPDAAENSMAWQRKEVIAVVSIATRGPDTDVEREGVAFIEEVLRGVQLSLRQAGWSVLIWVLPECRPLRCLPAAAEDLGEGRRDAHRRGHRQPGELARLAARIPIVLAAGSLDEPHADVVDAENWSGPTALTRHLLEQQAGHGCSTSPARRRPRTRGNAAAPLRKRWPGTPARA